MSLPNTIINNENTPTIVTVIFVLTVLSLMLNAYNYNQTQILAGMSLATHHAAVNQKVNTAHLTEKIEALEADAKKKAAAPPPAAPAAPAEAEAEAAPE